jgi:predicted RNA-binding Zn-ribbon protein involved in translation (DUF1610 family)
MAIELPKRPLPAEVEQTNGHALVCPRCGEKQVPMLYLLEVDASEENARLLFLCENCGGESWLEFEQHKGQTLVSWFPGDKY